MAFDAASVSVAAGAGTRADDPRRGDESTSAAMSGKPCRRRSRRRLDAGARLDRLHSDAGIVAAIRRPKARMRHDPEFRQIATRLAPEIRAGLGAPRPLRYGAAPAADSGVVPYVRAASAIRRLGSRLVVVQDDVNALAVMRATGYVTTLLLPPGRDGQRSFDDSRGNKRLKMDLEAAVRLSDSRLLAFGSGSARSRESMVLLEPDSNVHVHEAADLYVRLRELCAAVGAELNIEGAVVEGRRLRLFQRGNGQRAVVSGRANLIFDVDVTELVQWLEHKGPVPDVLQVLSIDLGSIDGSPFGFTDAAVTESGRIAFLACAEACTDVLSDGPVLGCRFGWLDASGAHVADILGTDGRATALKLEGIEPRADTDDVFDVVADLDRADEPALLAELRVRSSSPAPAPSLPSTRGRCGS
jgi:hypothetical protein